MLGYKNSSGNWDSIPVGLRARGHFRRANCALPPIRIKIKKSDGENSPFSGNKDLKLVVPCQGGKGYNELVMREYICYQLYKKIAYHNFNARLTEFTLTDQSKKNSKAMQLTGIFLEDDDLVAKRSGATIFKEPLHPLQFHDTLMVKIDFFQYMISNSDWSSAFQHNIIVLKTEDKTYLPVPYDFDMSGFVNAPYGVVSEQLNTTSVRDRVYRGFCQKPELLNSVRISYLKSESQIMGVLDDYQEELGQKEITDLKKFLGEFFSILKDEKSYVTNIVSQCRTK
jgi:hypothetical protein